MTDVMIWYSDDTLTMFLIASIALIFWADVQINWIFLVLRCDETRGGLKIITYNV